VQESVGAMAGQAVECYRQGRGLLENAAYAVHPPRSILATVWLYRHQDEAGMKGSKKVMRALSSGGRGSPPGPSPAKIRKIAAYFRKGVTFNVDSLCKAINSCLDEIFRSESAAYLANSAYGQPNREML
jgi:hypothetical protein